MADLRIVESEILSGFESDDGSYEVLHERATYVMVDPPADQNPLVQMFVAAERWVADRDLALALHGKAGGQRKSLMVLYPAVADQLGPDDAAFQKGGLVSPVERHGGRGNSRVYSRKALVLFAMAARTGNARSFRRWLAGEAAYRL